MIKLQLDVYSYRRQKIKFKEKLEILATVLVNQSTLETSPRGEYGQYSLFISPNRSDLHVYFKMFTEPRMCKWIVYLQGLTATSDAKSGLLVKLMWLCYFRAMLQRVHIPLEKAITES